MSADKLTRLDPSGKLVRQRCSCGAVVVEYRAGIYEQFDVQPLTAEDITIARILDRDLLELSNDGIPRVPVMLYSSVPRPRSIVLAAHLCGLQPIGEHKIERVKAKEERQWRQQTLIS